MSISLPKEQNSKFRITCYSPLSSSIVPITVPDPEKMSNELMFLEKQKSLCEHHYIQRMSEVEGLLEVASLSFSSYTWELV